MKRKIIRQGVNGYTIYLPSKWVEKFKLDKGSEVEIQPIGNDLVVSASNKNIPLEIDITLTHLSESTIRTLITNTYRKGYDKITVHYDSDKKFKILQKIIEKRLLGFEIIKKDENKCVVESVTEPSQEQFESILMKIFFSMGELFEIAEKKLSGSKEVVNFEEIEERIHRYDNFCRRVLIKQTLLNQNSEMMWGFLTMINHGQRELYHAIKELSGNKSSDLLKILNSSKQIFGMLREAYSKKDHFILGEIHSIYEEIMSKEMNKALMKTKEISATYHLLVSVREFYLATSQLSALIM